MSKQGLSWWKLSLIGVGCIIGTGYFLGSSLAIQQAGASVLIAYLTAGIVTWLVYQALAKMTADHMEKGSFRTYAKQAFGSWAGFSNGWVYWTAELLIMGSQLTALAIFAQFWFPSVPVWLCAAFFSVIGLFVLYLGVKKIEDLENVFGLMKAAAIVMFVLIGGAAMLGLLHNEGSDVQTQAFELFPKGGTGVWIALLYAFYAFGGVEVMGLMAGELKDPKQAEKSGRLMLFLLTILYVTSFFLVVRLAPLQEIDTEESPFITALKPLEWTWVSHAFNGILIIAGFSTMVASLYAVTTMVTALAEEGDAPSLFAKKGEEHTPLPAFILTTVMVIISVVFALLLPNNIFAYITTAAGLMLLYNWIFILFSYRTMMKPKGFALVKVVVAATMIAVAIVGTLFDATSRTGLWVSFVFLSLIAIATWIKQSRG